jgi:hypothetical protein
MNKVTVMTLKKKGLVDHCSNDLKNLVLPKKPFYKTWLFMVQMTDQKSGHLQKHTIITVLNRTKEPWSILPYSKPRFSGSNDHGLNLADLTRKVRT